MRWPSSERACRWPWNKTDTSCWPRVRTGRHEHHVPATAQTVYPIASVTKQFTAAAIMQLVEHGRLHPERHPRKLAARASLARRAGPTRHGPGIADPHLGNPGYTSLPRFRRLDAHPQSHASILALITGQPLKFAPGTRAGYSNSGYYLLGLIIERRSGLTYAIPSAALFAGLGLSHTARVPIGPRLARPSCTPGRPRAQPAPRISLVNAYAAGHLCSTVVDLLHWQVVSPTSYTQMTTPLRLADGRKIAYGFGRAGGTGWPCPGPGSGLLRSGSQELLEHGEVVRDHPPHRAPTNLVRAYVAPPHHESPPASPRSADQGVPVRMAGGGTFRTMAYCRRRLPRGADPHCGWPGLRQAWLPRFG